MIIRISIMLLSRHGIHFMSSQENITAAIPSFVTLIQVTNQAISGYTSKSQLTKHRRLTLVKKETKGWLMLAITSLHGGGQDTSESLYRQFLGSGSGTKSSSRPPSHKPNITENIHCKDITRLYSVLWACIYYSIKTNEKTQCGNSLSIIKLRGICFPYFIWKDETISSEVMLLSQLWFMNGSERHFLFQSLT